MLPLWFPPLHGPACSRCRRSRSASCSVCESLAYTARPHKTLTWHLPYVLVLPVATLILVAVAFEVADPGFYANLGTPAKHAPAMATLFFTLAGLVPGYLFVWACAYVYAEAFSEKQDD